MRCPKCQFTNPLGVVTCRRCGQRLDGEPEDAGRCREGRQSDIGCPTCQSWMPAEAFFCGLCGQRLRQPADADPADPLPVAGNRSEEDLGPSTASFLPAEDNAGRERPPTSLRPMVTIPAGQYQIGSPPAVGNPDEHPLHQVPLSAFCIDRCAVSNEEYERFDASHRRLRSEVADGDRDPVVFVSYEDCLRYCRWRSEQEGLPHNTYSLPTEAQWETAARGGRTDWIHPWGNAVSAEWCNTVETGRGRTLPVDEGRANGFGLIHIGSNVRQWCHDLYLPTYYSSADATRPDPRGPRDLHLVKMRVVRGASFQDKATELGRCAARNYAHPGSSCNDIGFRCVRKKN